jgi:hypothetical protein
MKKDCWKILNIPPTHDIETIKKAYRKLVKIYHPDKANTPEKVRKNTLKCAEINLAYEEALRQAKQKNSKENIYVSTKATEKPYPWYYNTFSFGLMIIGLIFSVLWIAIVGLIAEKIGSLPDQSLYKIIFSIAVIFLAGSVVFGFGIVGAFDFIIFYSFPRNLLGKIGLEKFENKIIWILITFVNITVFYGFGFGDFLLEREDPMRHLYAGIFKAASAGAIPVWLFINWLRELLIFKRLRKQHFQIIVDE